MATPLAADSSPLDSTFTVSGVPASHGNWERQREGGAVPMEPSPHFRTTHRSRLG